jgi:hypothetical protein
MLIEFSLTKLWVTDPVIFSRGEICGVEAKRKAQQVMVWEMGMEMRSDQQ